jgi:hypothetical protein
VSTHAVQLRQLRANCHIVLVGSLQLLFSYETVVAFNDGSGWVRSNNIWSATTGQHLHTVNGQQVPHEEFVDLLDGVLREWVPL